MQGWIKIHRKLIDWEWFQNSKMVHLFIYLLLKANHADRKWQGIIVKRGQLVTGRPKLSTETGISEPVVRKCLSNLKKSGEIDKKSTNKYTIITICNYDDYQDVLLENNQQGLLQRANKKPSKSQQKATNKNVNNIKDEKEYSNEILEFYDDIIRFFPTTTQPKTDSQKKQWLDTIEKLQKRESYSLLEIKKVVEYFRKDPFWSSNFLSIKKLRSLNKEDVMYIHFFAETLKIKAANSTVYTNKMHKTLKNPNRLKF